MKPLFLKNSMPFAVIALGISGAFATTSIQSIPENKVPIVGYLANSQNKCINTPVACETIPKPFLCRLNGTTGPIAYKKEDDDNCIEPLFRP
ncbi:hypothetical protein OIU80_11295 [Flavobacterium sp. LS1R47]|uniref:DUF2282 domain-containing protein n=1 Tax=Flavobacterium frigoritolerans TaxID=2987686 RepID=A0A9X2ZLB7_9FLAO|nr:hypothetical protein [Flavobacterium frigoritolerans]MCV9932870.1 hypothetical protein [Flavobacterium frigoritolerans]